MKHTIILSFVLLFIVLETENLYQLMWENKYLCLLVAIKTDIQTTVYVTVTLETWIQA